MVIDYRDCEEIFMSTHERKDEKDLIRVTMLGGFKIESGGEMIQDTAARTHQLWHLIEYLVTFRNKTISQDELIDVLWPGGDIENPSNALKNLVYRIRSFFNAYNLPFAREMITFNRGCYQWNNELNTYVDVEEFEELYKLASSDALESDRKIRKYMATIDIYKGDFLPGSCFESWVVPISSYYRSMYFKCVYAALGMLLDQQRYAEIEMICRKALIIDQFEENTHKYLISSMVKQGKQTQALAHYRFVTDLFFRELGINPSASMRDLYRDIIKTINDIETDINIVKEDLREPAQTSGAFYCDYEVFKNLYRLEARTAARSGQSIFISLLTCTDPQGNVLDIKLQSKVMDALYEVIKTSLRKGDVFSRFSATQYVLMLPTLTYENCLMVMDRVIKKYKQLYRPKSVNIFAKVQPLNPIEMSK